MMPYYFILNVPFNASDEQIRERYLQLVKQHTPEKDPVRFQAINEAYEGLKDLRTRVRNWLIGGMDVVIPEEGLMKLTLREIPRRRAGLQEILDAEEEHGT